jgi:hypothetical protein
MTVHWVEKICDRKLSTVRLESHLWIRYLLGFGWMIWSVEKIWMRDLDRHDPKKETAFDGWSLCSVNCCFFVLVAVMAQAMACSCSVASKFAWKLSSESPLFASSRSCSSCSSPIALFSFCFSSSFRKVRAIQRQRLRSHVLALAGCGSPSLSLFHHLEDLIFN